MKPTEMQLRYKELCAGRVIGDLTAEEVRELAGLCKQLGTSPDCSLDLLAAAVHADALKHSAETLPPHLAARLHQWADETTGATPVKTAVETNIIRPQPPAWRRLATHPFTGWIAAAAVLLFSLITNRDPRPLPPDQTAQDLPTTDSFKIFAAALTAAGMEDSLEGKGSLTLFAPTDEAFAKLPKGTLEKLLRPENKAMLHELVSQHVVAGQMPMSKVLESQEGKTLRGTRLNAHFDAGRVKIDHSNLVRADIQAPNSMIHVIDRVLLPERIKVIDPETGIIITHDGTRDIKSLSDLNKIPGIEITTVPVEPEDREGRTNMKELAGFLDGMKIERERY